MKISTFLLFFSILFIGYSSAIANDSNNKTATDNLAIDDTITATQGDDIIDEDSQIEEGDIEEIEESEVVGYILDNSTGYECAIIPINDRFICYGSKEVKQALYQKVMRSNPSHFRSSPENPVENVSMADVSNFIIKINKLTGRKYRLPTYDEWKFIADRELVKLGKLIDDGEYDKICKQYNLYDLTSDKLNMFGNKPFKCDDSFPYTAPIGSFEPNENDIYDIIGNVSEWTATRAKVKNSFYIAGWSFADSEMKMAVDEEGNVTIKNQRDDRASDAHFGALGFRLVLDIKEL